MRGWNRKLLIQWLKSYEEGDFTYVENDFPPVLRSARGVEVEDVEGHRYVDMTAFFGVCVLGHSPEFVLDEAKKGFYHGLGDYIPSEEKILLLKKLAEMLGGEWKGLLVQDGSDAVEACLRTAFLLKKSRKFIAFKGAYHGLSLGSLSATFRKKFKARFQQLLPFDVMFVEYSEKALNQIEDVLKKEKIAGIIIEPVQVRGGIKSSFPWIKDLRVLADRYEVPLIFDEIYTGFAKTGAMFAKDRFGVEPDLICLGKALSGAFPLSACMGKEWVMEAWGESSGEASYTFTFSGNPFFCRVALRNLDELERRKAPERALKIESFFKKELLSLRKHFPEKVIDVRGVGSLWGLELKGAGKGFELAKRLLKRGYITLPSGEKGEVLELTPPLIIEEKQLKEFLERLKDELESL